jgi:hypothetical protein
VYEWCGNCEAELDSYGREVTRQREHREEKFKLLFPKFWLPLFFIMAAFAYRTMFPAHGRATAETIFLNVLGLALILLLTIAGGIAIACRRFNRQKERRAFLRRRNRPQQGP